MARVGRTILVVLGPPILVCWPILRNLLAHGTAAISEQDVLVVSIVAHIAAAMLAIAALAMSVRLIWAASSLLSARALLWFDLAAAWGVVCAVAMAPIAHRLSFSDAVWGLSVVIAIANVASAALLGFMIRRAERGLARQKPWSMFA